MSIPATGEPRAHPGDAAAADISGAARGGGGTVGAALGGGEAAAVDVDADADAEWTAGGGGGSEAEGGEEEDDEETLDVEEALARAEGRHRSGDAETGAALFVLFCTVFLCSDNRLPSICWNPT